MAMLGEGGEFIVGRICLGGETGRRLADMGFCEGTRGRIVRRGFFHGPLHVHVCDGEVMIRSEEAEGIEVEPVGAEGGFGLRRGQSSRAGLGRGRSSGSGFRWGQSSRAGLGRGQSFDGGLGVDHGLAESDGMSPDPGKPGKGGPRGCCGSGNSGGRRDA